jgi:hypothetical protein
MKNWITFLMLMSVMLMTACSEKPSYKEEAKTVTMEYVKQEYGVEVVIDEIQGNSGTGWFNSTGLFANGHVKGNESAYFSLDVNCKDGCKIEEDTNLAVSEEFQLLTERS